MKDEKSRRNLQNKDFSNQDLTAADFSHADIRGANFAGSNLSKAIFFDTLSGISDTKITTLIIYSIIIGMLVSLPIFFLAFIVALSASFPSDTAGWVETDTNNLFYIALPFLVTLFWACQKGLTWEFCRKVFATNITLSIAVLLLDFFGGSSSLFSLMTQYYEHHNIVIKSFLIFSSIIMSRFGVSLIALLVIEVLTLIALIGLSSPFFLIISRIKKTKSISRCNLFIASSLAVIVLCIIGSFFLSKLMAFAYPDIISGIFSNSYSSFWPSFLFLYVHLSSIQFLFISCYFLTVGAVHGEEKFSSFVNLMSSISVIFGTSFQGAVLSDANFSQASIGITNFRNADLERVFWHGSEKMNLAKFSDGIYLSDPEVMKLLTLGKCTTKNLSGKQLKYANLSGLNLRQFNFSGADLRNSSLAEADLFESNLTSTRLDGADLRGCLLTGAYIEKWGVTKSTNLEDIICDYVYMRLPVEGRRDPNRIPPEEQGNFKPGEFKQFSQSLIDTLDLYHKDSFDPRSVVIALKELAEEFEEDLTIVALEYIDNQVIVKVKTSDALDHSLAAREYYPKYENINGLMPSNMNQIPTKYISLNDSISALTKGYNEDKLVVKVNINKGNFMVDQRQNINISGKVVNNAPGSFNNLRGKNRITNELVDNDSDLDDEDEAVLAELLLELKAIISQSNDLKDVDKGSLLDNLNKIPESESLEERQSLLRRVSKMFEAATKNLPDAAKLAESCNGLLSAILDIVNKVG